VKTFTFTLLLAAFTCTPSIAQQPTVKKPQKTKTATAPKKTTEKRTPPAGNFSVTETEEVRFTGTDEQLVNIFMENIRFDTNAVRAKAAGEVRIAFTVNPDSTVSNPVLIQNFGYNTDEQILALTQKLRFIPARMNGLAIKSNHLISIPLRAYIR
jgi:outer membrane biosynthesis protein TonB